MLFIYKRRKALKHEFSQYFKLKYFKVIQTNYSHRSFCHIIWSYAAAWYPEICNHNHFRKIHRCG